MSYSLRNTAKLGIYSKQNKRNKLRGHYRELSGISRDITLTFIMISAKFGEDRRQCSQNCIYDITTESGEAPVNQPNKIELVVIHY